MAAPGSTIKDQVRPRRAWYLVPLFLVVVGVVPSALALYSGVTGLTEGLIRVTAPGRADLSLDEPGTYQVFYEYRSSIDSVSYARPQTPPPMEIRVTSSEAPVSVSSGGTDFSYSLPGRAGVSVASFEADSPGTYVIDTRAEGSPFVLAIGHEKGEATAKTVLGAIGLIVFGLIAVIVFVLILILRILSKNRLERAAAAPPAN